MTDANLPVLVESSLTLVTDVLGEHSFERSESARSLDVTNNSDSDHWRSFDNCDGFDNLFLVRSCNNYVSYIRLWNQDVSQYLANNMVVSCMVCDELPQTE